MAAARRPASTRSTLRAGWSQLGAGEILLTSMDRDGTKAGYDLALTRAIADAVPVPVIASGGVGTLDHLVDGVRDGHATAVLAASIFHFGDLFHRARPSATWRAPGCRCGWIDLRGGADERFHPCDDLGADHRGARAAPPRRILDRQAACAGPERAAKKLGEEAVETVIAAVEQDRAS